ncbi:hypothetical protein ACQEVB_18330 [Pseudonocardia sp. CA-107938]|uniref:hypothetical protein n=1 Tax=Pseudonocardia sp. CA-107938 TaxID=3240021 RepID=UPI003D8D60DD
MSRMSIVLSELPVVHRLEFAPGAVVTLILETDGRTDELVLGGVLLRSQPVDPFRLRITVTASGVEAVATTSGADVMSRLERPVSVGATLTVAIHESSAWDTIELPVPRSYERRPAPVDSDEDFGSTGPVRPARRPPGRAQAAPGIAPRSGQACARHGISPPEQCPYCAPV